jgi:hypothetical protein
VLKGRGIGVFDAFHNERLMGIDPLLNGVCRLGIMFLKGIEENGSIMI